MKLTKGQEKALKSLMNMQNTIETLQQENDGWQKRYEELDAGNSKLFKDFLEAREALKLAQTTLTTLNNHGGLGYDKHRWINEALAAIDRVVKE
jgi:hypothetical protein